MQPYRIIAMPGGISGVIMEEAAVTTEENSSEKPFFVISGTIILDSMAASAMLEPDRPPMITPRKVSRNTTTKPTIRDTRPPYMMRLSTSKPSPSVPNRCAPEGASNMLIT